MNISAHASTSVNIDSHIGYRLRMRRRFRLMSEQRLADALTISRDDLFLYEEGRAQMPAKLMLAAADVLDVAPRFFFLGFEPQAPAETADAGGVRPVDRWFRDDVSPHEGLFLRVAQRFVGNLEAARDLVHDAYAAVLSNDRWRTVSNARAYVSQAVSNLGRDLIKRNKIVPMEPYADFDQFGFVDAAPTAQQAVEDRERLRAVMGAISKLPRQCRQVFVMRRIDDLPPREIAERLGIGIGTVESHLTRGMSELHRHLENHRKGVQLKVWLATKGAASEKTPDARNRRK